MSTHLLRTSRRVGIVAAGAAISVLCGGTAWAHHCYVEDWNEAAQSRLAEGGTAWMPLSDLADVVIAEQIGLPQCVGYGDQVAEAWMEATGAEEEPLIHSRATTGGGAAHKKGKEPAPFDYLGEDDFVILDAALGDAVGECLG